MSHFWIETDRGIESERVTPATCFRREAVEGLVLFAKLFSREKFILVEDDGSEDAPPYPADMLEYTDLKWARTPK